MNKVLIFLLIALVIMCAIGWYIFSSLNLEPAQNAKMSEQVISLQEQIVPSPSLAVYKSAKFAIYTRGTFRVFTASMYHNLSEDVYIQSDSPNIVRVKKVGITWDDFFKTLPFKLTKDCLTTGTGETFCTDLKKGTLSFYLNGVKKR